MNTRAWCLTAVGIAASALAGCESAPNIPRLAPVSAPAEPDPGVSYVAGDILGLSAPALEAALGRAGLARREGEGELRRYSFEACSLLVFLYPDETGRAAVRHMDAAALDGDAQAPTVDACLADPAAPRKAG